MKMTLQQAFNAAYIGVLAQGCKSTSDVEEGLYNDGKGNKCNIGHTMPEGTDVTDWNHRVVVELLEARHPSVAHLSGIDHSDLTEFQDCHDKTELGAAFIGRYTVNMEYFARRRGLTIPPTN